MNKHTSATATHLQYHGWVTFDAGGGMKMTRTTPYLNPGERAMKVEIKVPRSAFTTPQFFARVEVSDEAAQPTTIDALVEDKTAEALREAVGVDVVVAVKGGDA
jgi:hypothetical protein